MSEKGLILYHSYLSTMEDLSDAEFGRLVRAALEYSHAGTTRQLSGNERILFKTVKFQIDRDSEKYGKVCERNKANGQKGGRPKETQKIQSVISKPKKANVNENENEKVNENIKENTPKGVQKKKLGEFENVLLTNQEFEKLNAEYGAELPSIIEHLSTYIEMKGYKAKSHYLAIKKWVALACQEQKLRESSFENRKNQTFGGNANAGVNRTNYAEGEICTEFSEGDEPPEGIYD